MDNLASYVVADQKKFKVLESGDTRATIELAGPDTVYVNKGTKVAPGGKEAVNGKENGDMVSLKIPASKDPIKLKISR